ncbi:hypothetical protein R3P38DRAFT_2565267 [Favolaschia claudopus]|uniref:F-box domain-containing protein n=1 Tax=Favolaschia claudopus TaxID=2862362 RepID=A0AAV9ZZK9_9AGAR
MNFPDGVSSWVPTKDHFAYIQTIIRSGEDISDIPSLHTVIGSIQTEVAKRERELEQNRREHKILIKEHNLLSSYAQNCSTLLAPIRRLPRELLAEILGLCCCHENGSFSTNPDEELRNVCHRGLRQLAQVCTLWRRSVMGTPKLWSRISIRIKLWSRCSVSPDTLLSMLTFALNKGEQHPLHLRLIATSSYSHSALVLALLVSHASRWKNVNMMVDTGLQKTLAGLKGQLHQLQELRLNSVAIESNVFDYAPRLNKVSVEATSRINCLPKLPWGQLASVSYRGKVTTGLIDVFSCLSVASTVTNVEFFLDMLVPSSVALWTPVHSNTQSLTLCFAVEDVAIVDRVFDSLTLPSLQTFVFAPHEETVPVWAPHAFHSLARRSTFADHLTYLVIGARISDEQLLDCLALLINLQKLRVFDYATHVAITDKLLLGLKHSSGRSFVVAPRLELLYMATLLQFTDSIYFDLITSRVNGCCEGQASPFQVHIRCRPTRKRELSTELLDNIAKLEKEAKGRLIFKRRVLR